MIEALTHKIRIEVETRYLNAPRHADDVDERIREVLFAPLDYAIVART